MAPPMLPLLEARGPDAASLLSAHFIEQHWTRAPARWSPPPRAMQAHFGWSALNALLQSAHRQLVPPYVGLTTEEGALAFEAFSEEVLDRKNSPFRQLSSARLLAHCRAGATLVLNAVERMVPPLQALAHGFEERLGERAQCNLYFSAAPVAAFAPHFDTHEVFVLQVGGCKRWRLWPNPAALPLPQDPDDPQARPQGEPLEFVLREGEVLYLPRGWWHAALATEGPSLHLSLGIHARTRLDFLQWLAGRCARAPALRAYLHGVPGCPPDSADLKACLHAELRARLDDLDGELAAYAADCAARREPRPLAFELPALPGA
jgi:ribosomal protein L16 Arg81 hydroxylase